MHTRSAAAAAAAATPMAGATVTRAQRKRLAAAEAPGSAPGSAPESPWNAARTADKRRRLNDVDNVVVSTGYHGVVARLDQLCNCYQRADSAANSSARESGFDAALKLARAFVSDYGADCMPRMTLTDPDASWAAISTADASVNGAAAELCRSILQTLRGDTRRTLRRRSELMSASYAVLAVLACGKACTAAVTWLLEHARELVSVAARDMALESAQFFNVVCVHNLVYTEQGAEWLATGGISGTGDKDHDAVSATMKVVLRAMSEHLGSERVQNSGLLFCRNLTSHFEGQDAMLAFGLPPVLMAVIAALSEHRSSERLQIHGVSCLKYLTEAETCTRQTALALVRAICSAASSASDMLLWLATTQAPTM
jgi:hypothetical protein